MVARNLIGIYTKCKLNFYRQVLKRFDTSNHNLTALEIFCVETIYVLKSPTVNRFAEFMQISQANAAYKVNKLVSKGYIKKVQSKSDKREFYLAVTEKFMDYYNTTSTYMKTIAKRINKRFSKEQLQILDEFLGIIANELMPEVKIGV